MRKNRSSIWGLSPASCCHLFPVNEPQHFQTSDCEVFQAVNSVWIHSEREVDGKRRTFCIQMPIHRVPSKKAPSASYRAVFSMLKKLYLPPEIKMKIKTGLKASIVCPYGSLRNKFCGVIDFRKNLKCCIDRHKRISHTAWKQMLPISFFWLINRFNCISFSKWKKSDIQGVSALLDNHSITSLFSFLRLLNKILALIGFNIFNFNFFL